MYSLGNLCIIDKVKFIVVISIPSFLVPRTQSSLFQPRNKAAIIPAFLHFVSHRIKRVGVSGKAP